MDVCVIAGKGWKSAEPGGGLGAEMDREPALSKRALSLIDAGDPKVLHMSILTC